MSLPEEIADTVIFKDLIMKVRIISGTVFVAIIASFFLLREFVDVRLFSILLLFLSVCGTYEMANATRFITGDFVYFTTIASGFLLVPSFCVAKYFLSVNEILVSGGVIVLTLILNFIFSLFTKLRKDGGIFAILNALYPSVLIVFMLLVCHLPNGEGFIATLLLFVLSPFADTFAYFVGTIFGGPKLCPKISPKKTWSGAIGGVLGGGLGCFLVYLIFARNLGGLYTWYVFLIFGVVASIFTIFGDLFESFIKRHLGIKDMGKIMPGHGGVLDRIDGISFSAIVIFLLFAYIL